HYTLTALGGGPNLRKPPQVLSRFKPFAAQTPAGLREDSDRLQDEDQQGGPQHRHNPAHDGTACGQSKYAGQPEPQTRADDPDHDVGYDAHLRVRLHEDAGQPAHNAAHDQRDDPVHVLSSSIFVRRSFGVAWDPTDSTRTRSPALRRTKNRRLTVHPYAPVFLSRCAKQKYAATLPRLINTAIMFHAITGRERMRRP